MMSKDMFNTSSRAFFTKLCAIMLPICFLGCWNKQHHEITAPETPVYLLSGRVLDLDSRQPMPGMVVKLTAETMLYDYDFTEATDTTDAEGKYSYAKITPGTYLITGYRQGYPVLEETLVMQHEDKQFELALPKYLIARRRFDSKDFPRFTGICWLAPEVMAGSSVWRRHWDDDPFSSIMRGNFADGFERLGAEINLRENPAFYGLAYLDRYWTTDGNFPYTTVFTIDPAKGTIEGRTLTSFSIRDLTSDKTHLWATAEPGKIIKFGVHPSIVEGIYDITAQQPYGIAWSGTNMWIYDQATNLLLDLGENFVVRTSFRPFGWDEKNTQAYLLTNLRYLAFDFYGDLWANDSLSVYEFELMGY